MLYLCFLVVTSKQGEILVREVLVWGVLVRCMRGALVRVLMVAAYAAWLSCIGGLAFCMHVCAFGGFLL